MTPMSRCKFAPKHAPFSPILFNNGLNFISLCDIFAHQIWKMGIVYIVIYDILVVQFTPLLRKRVPANKSWRQVKSFT